MSQIFVKVWKVDKEQQQQNFKKFSIFSAGKEVTTQYSFLSNRIILLNMNIHKTVSK